jgi:kynureninase
MNEYQELVKSKLDDKWDDIFSNIIPRTQSIIAKHSQWSHPNYVSFAGSTHELLIRLFSALIKNNQPLKVLTSEFEYHSARRLFQNLKSHQLIELEAINCPPVEITDQLTTKLAHAKFDVCFLSQCFFQSGYTISEKFLMELFKKFPETLFIIDCYHTFAAREINFTSTCKNFALLGGGYKYAMSGEGCCFLAVHPELKVQEPIYNGWMSEFSSLNKSSGSILNPAPVTLGYYRFLGATFDPIGIYRMASVWEYFEKGKNHTWAN